MTRTIRRISQLLFFGLFLWLIYKTAYPLNSAIPVDFLTRLDPLVALVAAISSRTFVAGMATALVIVVLTILLGRVFCGWICPLGTTLDASDKLFFRKARRNVPKNLHSLKYFILIGILVSAVFTTQAAYLLDPLSLLTRTVTLVVVPPVQMVFRWLQEAFYVLSGSQFGLLASIGTRLSDALGSWQFLSGQQLYFRQALLVLAVFVAIISLNSISRRFWCRNLCPLGALLGLLSHVPILKRVVTNDCIDCGRCVIDCKMGAIPRNPRLTASTECIECFDCVPICPKKAESFRLRLKPAINSETRLDLPRRRVLQGAGVGLAFAAMVKIDPGRKHALSGSSNIKLSSSQLIRPPGAVEESKFVTLCTRCGQCMKACPTNGLQPAIHEAGLEGFWTPILVPRIGCCQQDCNACGQVCPTDAIQPFKVEDKPHIFIGTAVIDRSMCIAWNSGKTCLVCDEYCSYKAIKWEADETGIRRPFVDDTICVGCGICESACPVQPVAAIRVYSLGDKRGS
ncbi:MAG: 4Fe-4S dicluster domain-containing protein [Armatimonadetes bacterium]|nr:4Fe-4S dicluster domain-containing protein [Armatimonadota bacterium]